MADDSELCKIPGNPDIAGIGVRSAIYLQAALGIVTYGYLLQTYVKEGPILLERYIQIKAEANDPPTDEIHQREPYPPDEEESLQSDSAQVQNESEHVDEAQNDSDDGRAARREQLQYAQKRKLEAIIRFTSHGRRVDEDKECMSMSRGLSRSIILVGAAVLVSTLLEANSERGLTPYHTLIILNVSLINNWSAVIVGLISKYLALKHFVLTKLTQSAQKKALLDEGDFLKSRWGWVATLVLDEMAVLIHVYITCALGFWFWAKPHHGAFSHYLDDIGESCPPIETYYWIFKTVSRTNPTLRIISLVAYSIYTFISLPITQITLGGFPMPVFVALITSMPLLILLILYLILETITVSTLSRSFRRGPLFRECHRLYPVLTSFDQSTKSRRHELESRENRHKFYAILSHAAWPLVLLGVIPYLFLVISTERVVRINQPNISKGERDWTYGQTLALFTAIVASCTFLGTMGKVIFVRKQVQKAQEVHDEEKPIEE